MAASFKRATAAQESVVAGLILAVAHLATASTRRWANMNVGIVSWQVIVAIFVSDVIESMLSVPVQHRPAAIRS